MSDFTGFISYSTNLLSLAVATAVLATCALIIGPCVFNYMQCWESPANLVGWNTVIASCRTVYPTCVCVCACVCACVCVRVCV